MRARPLPVIILLALAACTGRLTGGDSPGAGADAALAVDDGGPRDSSVADPGSEGDGEYTIGPSYADAPELTVADGVPRGTVFHFTMDSTDSAIFPGVTGPFTRDVWVYVPQQYVDGSEAPFMVVQDGGGFVEVVTAALDTMIDAGDLPALIAILINPGPGDGRGSERGYEYDTVSVDYTTFIETEVLPIIPARPDIAAAYPDLRFTSDPEGRASMGASSGGACAFTMGWFRPDLYRRILTYSGTFVNQHPDASYPHSAWEYHEHLIAESPAKPLRVFLEVGENDNNLDDKYGDGMHDWVAANRAMAAALTARGYHQRFLYALDAGHVDRRVVRQTLPDALRWLWRGYPIR
jgi:enterochelin esterase family protein